MKCLSYLQGFYAAIMGLDKFSREEGWVKSHIEYNAGFEAGQQATASIAEAAACEFPGLVDDDDDDDEYTLTYVWEEE